MMDATAPVKKRYGTLALLMNLLAPGLGFLYSGAWWLALLTPVLLTGIVIAFALMDWIFMPYGILALLFSLTIVYVLSGVLAFFSARKRSPSQRHFFQHWSVYLLFISAFFFTQLIFKEQRPAWLGYETFRLPSTSMSPTLIPNDFVVTDTEVYKRTSPKRGDIIVFSRLDQQGVKFTKRVIAVAGDSLKVNRGQILVNNKLVDEPYVLAGNNQRSGLLSSDLLHIPDGVVFVLGDNRDNSFDSRYFGAVKMGDVYGQVKTLWFSFDAQYGRVRWERFRNF